MRVLSFLFIIALVLPGIAIAQELGELPTKSVLKMVRSYLAPIVMMAHDC